VIVVTALGAALTALAKKLKNRVERKAGEIVDALRSRDDDLTRLLTRFESLTRLLDGMTEAIQLWENQGVKASEKLREAVASAVQALESADAFFAKYDGPMMSRLKDATWRDKFVKRIDRRVRDLKMHKEDLDTLLKVGTVVYVGKRHDQLSSQVQAGFDGLQSRLDNLASNQRKTKKKTTKKKAEAGKWYLAYWPLCGQHDGKSHCSVGCAGDDLAPPQERRSDSSQSRPIAFRERVSSGSSGDSLDSNLSAYTEDTFACLRLADLVDPENHCVANMCLAEYELSHHDALAMCRELATSSTVTVWNASSCKAFASYEVVDTLFAEPGAADKLVELDLSYIGLDADCMASLGRALRTDTSIRTLRLLSNALGPDQMKAFAREFRGNATLARLYVDNNELGDDSALAQAVTGSKITLVSAPSNDLGDAGAGLMWEAFKARADANCPVRAARLANNRVSAAGMDALWDILIHTQLESLNASSNEIVSYNSSGVASIQRLVTTLRLSGSLVKLWLRNCRLTAPCGAALADALDAHPTLKLLDVQGNDLSGCAEAFCCLLENNRRLETLNLAGNGIDDRGAKLLARGLTHNRALRSLDLDDNEICCPGATAIANVFFLKTRTGVAVRANTTLEELFIRKNRLTETAIQRLETAQDENTHRRFLVVASAHDLHFH